MDLNTIANVSTAITVLSGLIFGIVQLTDAQRKRRHIAAIEAAHGFLTPELRGAFRRILMEDAPLDVESFRENPGLTNDAEVIIYSAEAFGVMVYERAIGLHTIDRLMGGFLRSAWRHLARYVDAERRVYGVNFAEWYQWLVERLEEHPAPGKQEGAYLAHRAWKP